MHVDLMVSHCQVERREKLGTSESIKYVNDSRQRMCVFLRHQVELTLVDAETPAFVLLFDQNGRTRKR